MIKKTSLIYIHLFRVLATILLVYYHCLCYYTLRWPYTGLKCPFYDYLGECIVDFALPLFVFISGYLYRYLKNRGKYSSSLIFIRKKVHRLLLPWLFWSICFYSLTNKNIPSIIFFLNGGYNHLWFLFMLFLQFLLTPIYNKIYDSKNKRIDVLFILILCILSWLFTRNPLRQIPLLIPSTIKYSYVFYLGIFVNKKNNLHISKILKIFVFFIYISLPLFSLPYGLSVLLLNICVSIILISILDAIKNQKLKFESKLIFLSKLSMGVYIFHHIILDVLLQSIKFRELMDSFVLMPIFLLPLLLLICGVVSYLFLKNKYLFKLI